MYFFQDDYTYDDVKQRGALVRSKNFGIIYLKSDEGEVTKFGIVVSKKLDKRATVRNKIKRKLRNCVVNYGPSLKRGYKIIILAKKEVFGESERDLMLEFSNIFNNIKILN